MTGAASSNEHVGNEHAVRGAVRGAGVIDLGALKATWREKFFAVMMWEGQAPAPTEMYDSYADAVNAAKRHSPAPDVFEVKKITERVR